MTIKKIKIPIYFGVLIIAVSNDFCEAERMLGIKTESPRTGFDAYALNTSPPDGLSRYVVMIKPSATPNIVAHEAFHIVNMIFKDRGVMYGLDNDEHAAYFLSWVVEQIHLCLDKNKD